MFFRSGSEGRGCSHPSSVFFSFSSSSWEPSSASNSQNGSDGGAQARAPKRQWRGNPRKQRRTPLLVLSQHRPLCNRFLAFHCFAPARGRGGTDRARKVEGYGKSVVEVMGKMP